MWMLTAVLGRCLGQHAGVQHMVGWRSTQAAVGKSNSLRCYATANTALSLHGSACDVRLFDAAAPACVCCGAVLLQLGKSLEAELKVRQECIVMSHNT